MDLAEADRRRRRQPLDRALARLQQLVRADHLRDGRVLDDVHEQAHERRQESAERLRHDHERVPADPAEAERGRRFVLLARNRLHGPPRRLGDLGAAPEDEPDRGCGERFEPEAEVTAGSAK